MTEVAAKRVWTVMSALICVLAFNYFSVSQSWKVSIDIPFLGIDIGVSNSIEASVSGIPVVAIGLLFTSYIGLRFAKSVGTKAEHWSGRVPIAVPGFRQGTQETKVLATLSLLLMSVFPLSALWHLTRKFHKYAEICDINTGSTVSLFQLPTNWFLWNNDYLVGPSGESCEGVTYEPFIQPSLQLIIVSCATVAVLCFMLNVFSTKFSFAHKQK